MNRKVIFIVENGDLVDILDVKTIVSPEEYAKLVKTAKENKERHIVESASLKSEKEIAEKKIVEDLRKDINLLKLEVSLLRGEITDEEYEKEKTNYVE